MFFFLFKNYSSFSLLQGKLLGASKSKLDVIDSDGFVHLEADREHEFRKKNRQQGTDAITSSLSAFYAKLMVVLGVTFFNTTNKDSIY